MTPRKLTVEVNYMLKSTLHLSLEDFETGFLRVKTINRNPV